VFVKWRNGVRSGSAFGNSCGVGIWTFRCGWVEVRGRGEKVVGGEVRESVSLKLLMGGVLGHWQTRKRGNYRRHVTGEHAAMHAAIAAVFST
jgi:hypothetical protein